MRKESAKTRHNFKRRLQKRNLNMGPKLKNKWNIGTENDGNSKKWNLNNFYETRRTRCARITQGSRIFCDKEWARYVHDCYGKLELYTWSTYKNGADIWKSLKHDKLLTFIPPKLDEHVMATQKEMWRIWLNNTIKQAELLEANLETM